MRGIESSTSLLKGQWVVRDGRIIADETCQLIHELISSHLQELGRDPSGWDTLYRDPIDERLWELTFPQSELHGGGPPQLSCLGQEEALRKYGSLPGLLI